MLLFRGYEMTYDINSINRNLIDVECDLFVNLPSLVLYYYDDTIGIPTILFSRFFLT